MMHYDIWLLIFGMAIVTYLPRALPAILTERLRFGKRTNRFLSLIPYTAMSALVFPGIFTVDSTHPLIGVAGGMAAVFLAWRKQPLILCVLAAILVDCMLYLII